MADLHCRVDSLHELRDMMAGIGDEAEVLLLPGDLTNLGLIEETEVLLEILSHLSLPIVAVVGNHDHESDNVEVIVHMLSSAGVKVLDADVWEHRGVEFVGTKGFAGGFGDHRLQPFGEKVLKKFIHYSIHEVARFETALESMRATQRVALLHYSPIAATLSGECVEIYPFLGFSLFADALDRHGVDIVVHGHAHHGMLTGSTPGGIPVRNVSRYVLNRHIGRPYCVFEV